MGRLAIIVKEKPMSIFLLVVVLSLFPFCSLWSWLVDKNGGSVIGVFVVMSRRLGGKACRKIRGCSMHVHMCRHVDKRLALAGLASAQVVSSSTCKMHFVFVEFPTTTSGSGMHILPLLSTCALGIARSVMMTVHQKCQQHVKMGFEGLKMQR